MARTRKCGSDEKFLWLPFLPYSIQHPLALITLYLFWMFLYFSVRAEYMKKFPNLKNNQQVHIGPGSVTYQTVVIGIYSSFLFTENTVLYYALRGTVGHPFIDMSDSQRYPWNLYPIKMIKNQNWLLW